MPSRAITAAFVPKTYPELRDAVMAVVVEGRRAIDRAWVETYHETGRLINEHVLLFRERADYGAKTYVRLEKDTQIDERTLRQCAQFQRCFPIWSTCSKLSWSKCRLLCQVSDATQREKLRVLTLKNDWVVDELEARVRAINATAIESGEKKAAELIELLKPRRGTPGLHPIVDRGAGPAVDLGFMLYRELGGASKLTTKDIVRLNPSTGLRAGEAGVRRVEGATKAELFTYTATIRRVIDGDTFVAAVMVAPGYSRELKLRLRGLDCPEMSTAAGRAAKLFVDGSLKPGDEVIISTTKPDKFDRYLADVFIKRSDVGRVTSDELRTELFLNNALLEAGHAVRYDGGAKEEM